MEYIYTFIRTDIGIAQQIVQSSHSAFHAGEKFGNGNIPSLVLIQVKDETELLEIQDMLESKMIKSHIFYEPDYNTGFTSLTTEPISGKVRNHFKHFKLWKP